MMEARGVALVYTLPIATLMLIYDAALLHYAVRYVDTDATAKSAPPYCCRLPLLTSLRCRRFDAMLPLRFAITMMLACRAL